MIVRYTLHKGQKLTEEQIERLEKLKNMPDSEIVYDEDCPMLTEEQIEAFRKAAKERNRRVGRPVPPPEEEFELSGQQYTEVV